MLFTPSLQASPVEEATRVVTTQWTLAKEKDAPIKLGEFFAPQEQARDDLHRESPALQEAGAARALLARGRRLAVLACQDGLCALELAIGRNGIHDRLRNALAAQVMADAGRA